MIDASPLGLVTHPGGSEEAEACRNWLLDAALDGLTVVVVPEIVNYEARRELIRARRTAGIARLDALIARAHEIEYPALDGEVIVAAQAATLDRADVVVATTNVRHLSRFVPAELWSDIA